MKHLKTFENLSEDSEFKIGQYVRFSDGYYIYQVTQYNEDLNKYYLEDTLQSDGYKRPDLYWIPSYNLKIVPEYEISAIKYNL